MDVATSRRARRLALPFTCCAVFVIVAAVYAAWWTPGTLDLSIEGGRLASRTVAWVAPDGPAWSAGVRPGITVVADNNDIAHGAPPALTVWEGRQRVVLGAQTTRVDPLDLPVSALGLCLLLFGAYVLAKGRDRRATAAFWRMCQLIGLALGVVPAGFHGVPWAIALCFVTLALFGPALLELALVFPSTGVPISTRRRALLWLPALALVPFYLLCWWRPAPLFEIVGTAGDASLTGYILAACGRLVWVWRHPRSALQQAQLHWLGLGLISAFLPLVALNLLPHIVAGRDLLPPQVSILALALLPLSVGIAIVRTEVFGITSLMRRRTLRALVIVALLAGVAVVAGGIASLGAWRWGWPTPAAAAGTSALTAAGTLFLRPRLTRRAEHALFRDVYDPVDAMLRLRADLSRATPDALGPLFVTRLVTTCDLDFALLVTATDYYLHAHTRSAVPAAVLEHVTQHARTLLAAVAPAHPVLDVVDGLPLLVLPIGDGWRALAVVCCGPKHSGDRYTQEDQSLLRALGHDLTTRFQLQAQLDEQATLLHALRDASAPAVLIAPELASPVGEPLSRSELRVLVHLAQGLSYKDTAERLEREPETIEKHAKNIRRKLGVRAITDAVAIARQRGLLPLE